MTDDRPELPPDVAAALEIQRRRRARETTADYITYVSHRDMPRHGRFIAGKFDRLEAGDYDRLMIAVPPGHMKSWISQHFIARFMARNPGLPVIHASHTQKLVARWGGRIRNLYNSPEHQRLYPDDMVSSDVRASDEWETQRGASYIAAGVDTAIQGRRGGLVVIDDPIRSIDDAESETVRETLWQWYGGDLSTRLLPSAKVVLIQCVAEGERVMTVDRGWRPIEDVRPGERVWTFDNGRSTERVVEGVKCSGEDDVFDVVSQTASLKVNARHPFLVVRGGLQKAAKTQVDVEASREWTLEWVKCEDLRVGDMVVHAKATGARDGHRKYNPFTKKLFGIEGHWLLGFIMGDGWVIKSKTEGPMGLSIAKSSYPDLNARAWSGMKNIFCLNPRDTAHGYYTATGRPVARWLMQNGFGGYARTKRVPEWIFRARKSDQRAFLRGYLDADGSVRKAMREKYAQWTAGTVNRELLDDMRLLARMCGVRTTKIYTWTGPIKAPNSKEAKETTVYYARFTFRHQKMELRARYRHQGAMANVFRFERIEAIKPAGRARVYDLQVEGSENFIAEGFVVHNTRFHLDDLAGRLLQAVRDGFGEPWETCILPAIAGENDPYGRAPGEALWPEEYGLEVLERRKRQPAMTKRLWSALYQQSPTIDTGGIIDRRWFRLWKSVEPPKIKFVLQSWDTALTANKESAYSACTTWGVFDEPTAREERGVIVEQSENIPALILLSAFRKRMEWPELRRTVQRLAADYRDDGSMPVKVDGKHRPDMVLVEAKANGRALLLDLMHAGVSAMGFNPDKYGDKIARVRLVTDLIENGRVWLPGEPPGFTRPRYWAEEFQQQCAAFPVDASRDYVDTMTQAFLRVKASGWVMNTEDPGLRDADRRATGGVAQPFY